MKLKKFGVILCIFLITFVAPVTGNESINSENYNLSIVVGPYPQNPKIDSISILWTTSSATTDNSVYYGLTPSCENVVYNNISSNFHEIELEGLSPSTKYYYKVISETLESDVYFFYTTFEEDEFIRFIAFGDSRGVWDNWVNAGFVASAIEKENPFFVIHTGDIVNDGKVLSEWIDYFSISKFVHNSTLFPSLGNHENYGDPYFKYFILPNNEYWYSFDSGPVHFICLDSNFRNSLRLSQLFWLINDLRSNTKPFTIVYFHYPPYSSGNHGSTYILRFLWGFIFEYFKVDIVFNGHDHCYERGKVESVNYILTGGGGAPPYNVGESWWTIHSEKTYHYCVVTVNSDELIFEAKKPDGTIFDFFSIIK